MRIGLASEAMWPNELRIPTTVPISPSIGAEHADIHDIKHALVERRGDPVALGFRDNADRIGIGVGMALEEMKRAVNDPRRGLRALGDVGGEAVEVLVFEEGFHALEQFRRGDALRRQREEAVGDEASA